MDEYRLRTRIFIGVILALTVLLGMRLVELQLIDTEEYLTESQGNAVRQQRVIPARGIIKDRHGEILVDNESTYTVTLTPRYFDTTRVALLGEILEMPDSTLRARIRQARDFSPFQPSPIMREVPFASLSLLEENRYRLPGVAYEIEQQRRYHDEVSGAHMFGYIREINGRDLERRREQNDETYRQGDVIGQTGLERYYERYLRGDLGSEFKLVNIHGRMVTNYQDGANDTPPSSGYELHTGLDARVQAIAESLFVGKRGGVVAMDPNNGEIIALVSKPDYDPEIFSESVSPEMWSYLTSSEGPRPMFNRATMTLMPPGSTWKPFMSLMALQEGLIEPGETVTCRGGHPLGRGVRFRCMGVHGAIDTERAIQKSCNTFFFEMMMRTDVNTFARYANAFGFGVQAPTDLTEQTPGLIPDSAYFNRVYPDGWTVGYSINLGIGQGDMGVTPLQLARYTAAVANGGTMHAPRVVSKLVHPETGEEIIPEVAQSEQLPIDPQYYDLVREGMRLTFEAGSATAVAIPGIEAAGKTGTAQNPHGEDHSLFIMFAPYDDPQIAIAALVENAGYGGSAAAPIASIMAEQYLTGRIDRDNPRRQFVLNRAYNARSEEIPGMTMEPPKPPQYEERLRDQ
jgi:penicillin-binding protein 2